MFHCYASLRECTYIIISIPYMVPIGYSLSMFIPFNTSETFVADPAGTNHREVASGPT